MAFVRLQVTFYNFNDEGVSYGRPRHKFLWVQYDSVVQFNQDQSTCFRRIVHKIETALGEKVADGRLIEPLETYDWLPRGAKLAFNAQLN